MIEALSKLPHPVNYARFDLTIAARDSQRLRPHVEHVLRHKGVSYDLWGSSPSELRYEVNVPLGQRVEKLTKLIRKLDGRDTTSIEWKQKNRKDVW
jgi:hypothetical protein